jgi:DNA-binding ferritin-like protein
MRQLKLDSNATLKRPMKAGCEALAFNLLNSITIIHMAHLAITGTGSYAAHRALGDYYEEVGDFVDSVVEQYQGVTGRIMDFPDQCSLPRLKTAEACCTYLKSLRDEIDREQAALPYSEIVNVLDEIKSLINSTCYKLTFLK